MLYYSLCYDKEFITNEFIFSSILTLFFSIADLLHEAIRKYKKSEIFDFENLVIEYIINSGNENNLTTAIELAIKL